MLCQHASCSAGMMRVLLLAALAAGSARSTDAFDNMNGAYSYTPTPHAPQKNTTSLAMARTTSK